MSDFDACVYTGSIYNGSSHRYESIEFIYIGYIGFDNKRQNIILTDIEKEPACRVVKRSDIAQHIMAGSVRSVSVHHLLHLMQKVKNVPSNAKTAWDNAYSVRLEQWVEGKHFEKSCEKIRAAWLNAFYNPEFVFCIQRLRREFANMSGGVLS